MVENTLQTKAKRVIWAVGQHYETASLESFRLAAKIPESISTIPEQAVGDYLRYVAYKGHLGAMQEAKNRGLLNSNNAADVYHQLIEDLFFATHGGVEIVNYYDKPEAKRNMIEKLADWILGSFTFNANDVKKIWDSYNVESPTPWAFLISQSERLPFSQKQRDVLVHVVLDVGAECDENIAAAPISYCLEALQSANKAPEFSWTLGMLLGRYVEIYGESEAIKLLETEGFEIKPEEKLAATKLKDAYHFSKLGLSGNL